MALTIGEANDLNTLLDHVLSLPRDAVSNRVPTTEEAQQAAVRLIDRANKVLSAGLTGQQVLAAWPDPPRTCRECGCTDDRACVDALGQPCGWSAEDLCTKCDPFDPITDTAGHRDDELAAEPS